MRVQLKPSAPPRRTRTERLQPEAGLASLAGVNAGLYEDAGPGDPATRANTATPAAVISFVEGDFIRTRPP